MEGILAITFIFGGGSLFLLAISPVGRAIGDRIRGVGVPQDVLREMKESQVALLEEVDQLRQEVVDLQERLDFAERLLAQQRGVGRLAAPERGGGPADVPE